MVVWAVTGCLSHRATVHPDSDTSGTKYDLDWCYKELAYGVELRSDQIIDMLVAYKGRREIFGYRNGKVVFHSKMSLGKNGDKGPKTQVGDYKTPEGTYRIVRKKCDPKYYRSLMISYPNEQDKARSRALGVNPGGYINIHGQLKWNADGHADSYALSRDWTEGCMAIPNKKLAQLWAGVRKGVPIVIYP